MTEIPRAMKAVRFHDRGDLRLQSITPLPCGPDEVRIKVAYCGICGSDLHEYIAGPLFVPKHGQKHPYNGSKLPVTLGHEISGVITEVGDGVAPNHLKAGQRVFVNPCIRDRQLGVPPCLMCQEGKENLCPRLGFYGLSGPGGGLAESLVVKAINVFPLPNSVSLKVAALVEPLAVAWHCVRVSGIQSGQDAVVLGAGPIGLAILMILKVWGARKVVVSEVLPARAALARKFGADCVVNPLEKGGDEDPVVAKAREFSGGHLGGGAHVSFDASGIQETLETSIACVRQGGTVLNLAIHEKPLKLNFNVLTLSEKKLMGGLCYTNEDIEGVINALANGSLVADELITSVVTLEDAIQGAFEELIHRRENHVKILVQPNSVEDIA
ncbi:hypothetical protein LOZ53_005624 [Ophidiomyces ophidiicola]|nr:hypothetical protein LOZ54_006003 [Ophidiomyces ophidiicola]KAI1979866.1 hypothetical protein LOZ55_001769 [Ophidiomyces ophidiicola]KAI1984023.1 hypothetical protein LOZ53_005624 [Ophidiomyces ophidiicola]KAI1994473.1 hypothetical protein LOZ51_003663 [Ophidiomyces ophidiicola]KAI2091299.1 hypothetical protein LOZ36_000946 [Ophidiomyces ophidiicola]